MKNTRFPNAGFSLGVALLTALTGCAGYVEEPRRGPAHDRRQPVYGYAGAMTRDGYVYYPNYQVYYNSDRRQYIYQDGGSWVSRRVPPHVPANVLQASPSVRLDFRDSPAAHHSTVVRQYPKHWTPSTGDPDQDQ